MHPLAFAGFSSALAMAHATVAACSLFLYLRPARTDPSRAPPSTRGPAQPDLELVVFGLLNLAVAVLDAGLARAYASSGSAERLAASLTLAESGRIAAVALLVHFILQYGRVRRPTWALTSLYSGVAIFELANVLGAMGRSGEARADRAWILGVELPALRTPPSPLGVAFAVASLAGALFALAILGRAFLRGRREAVGFVGMTLLTVAALYDALRGVGWVIGPPLAPLGYAAFANGVMVTLLYRFTALRGQLEDRARDLKDRSRRLARSYEELRAAQDELVRKEQLAAVGELSAVVAHEVRNPLAIISNAVATLRRPGIGDEDRETLLRILDEESSRLNRLVGELLRFARPINVERQLVSIRELVERGMRLAETRLDVDAELVEAEPVEKVWADANLIRQVTDNLIDNALQAMTGGGVLTVTLLNLELDGARGVEVRIQDTGEGMDTQVRARALDPFFTTRPSGTGLGLAIVARIVDAHGGVLRIESKAGTGTVMAVFLPIRGEPPPRVIRSDRPDRQSSEPPLPPGLRSVMQGRAPKG